MFKDLFLAYLKQNNVLNDDEFNEVLEKVNNGESLLDVLADGYLRQDAVNSYLAEYLGIETKEIQLSELNFDLLQKHPVDHFLINKYFPFYEDDDNTYYAISDLTTIESVYELKKDANKGFKFVLIPQSNMEFLLGYLNNKIKQSDVLTNYADEESDITVGSAAGDDEQNAPIITLCDSIINDAVSRNASDIHIEPFENEIVVRYRIDGKLLTANKLKPHIFQPLVARYKIMSELNIAERRLPQDGKILKEINGNSYDFRVSTMPTIHGEKIVIRIFNRSLNTNNLDLLGLNDKQKADIKNAISRPHGIILLTGPTGSGKSTSLYAFLRYLNKGDTNIITVEDPVENQIDGVNQVQVNNKANLTFANVLRAILRQDPNIIMIGEIRDEETAQIATRAAITGHLVFSTLHTNSAASVVSRLVDMGVPPYLVADSLLCSISQRLVRKLCPNCKKEHETSHGEMEILGIKKPKKIYEPCGCTLCSGTGYSGRTAVFEILPIDEKVRNIIMSKEYTSELLHNSVKDFIPSLIDDARDKVLSGETSVEEFEELIEEFKLADNK